MANDVSGRIGTASVHSVVILDSDYTIDERDAIIICKHSAPITITTLPAAVLSSVQLWFLIDATDDAENNNITIEAGVGCTVNGGPNLVIDADGYNATIFFIDGDHIMRDPERFDFPPIP